MLFSTFNVTNLHDNGSGSLRAAVEAANRTAVADTVKFSSKLNGTVRLKTGALRIAYPLTIEGPGAGKVTLDASKNFEGGDSDSPAGAFRVGDLADAAIDVRITGLTIARGAPDSGGGGIFNAGGSLTVSNCVLRDNVCTGGDGAGISNEGGRLVVENSTLTGNYAAGSNGGGAIYSSDGDVTLRGCTVDHNRSNGGTFAGGGVLVDGGSLLMENCTVSANEQSDGYPAAGGGVAVFGASALIRNCTITGNVAGSEDRGQGGGIFVSKDGVLTLQSSIVTRNAAPGGGWDVESDGSGNVSATRCLIGRAGAGMLAEGSSGNLFDVDPKLGPLADNGGVTQTHALLTGSPAIDAGSNPGGLSADQRGNARKQGAAVDIGAYESSGGAGGNGGVVVGADPSTTSGAQALIVTGTAGNDTITIDKGSSSGKVRVKINGSDKGQLTATDRIYVYAGGGNDKVTVNSNVKNTVFLFGGDGNDTLSGGGANDVLLGGGGADTLKGNGGRDILFGDAGADTISGGDGDDVLVGDKQGRPFSEADLRSLMAEWGDPSKSYSTRCESLFSGTGKLASPLGSATLDDDGKVDVLTGNAGNDLFFSNLGGAGNGATDKLKDKASAEGSVDVD